LGFTVPLSTAEVCVTEEGAFVSTVGGLVTAWAYLTTTAIAATTAMLTAAVRHPARPTALLIPSPY
jgi:hypothetical protein